MIICIVRSPKITKKCRTIEPYCQLYQEFYKNKEAMKRNSLNLCLQKFVLKKEADRIKQIKQKFKNINKSIYIHFFSGINLSQYQQLLILLAIQGHINNNKSSFKIRKFFNKLIYFLQIADCAKYIYHYDYLQSLILNFKYMFKKIKNKDEKQPAIQFIQVKASDGSIKKFIKNRLIGTGGFARCYEVTLQSTNQTFAVKILKKSMLKEQKLQQTLRSQISIHRQMHHDHVVKFIDSFQNKDYVYILLQLCNHQSLQQLIIRRKYITELQTRYYIRQILLSLQYLQANKIIHRDLKLCNLFISDHLQIKLGDFGLATKLRDDSQRKFTNCGTIDFIAPQILREEQDGYSYEVDVWSLGVITYKLLFGVQPFKHSSDNQIQNSIIKCEYNFPKNPNVSNQATTFIRKILQLNPNKRPKVSELLSDQFITKSQIPQIMPNSTLNFQPQKCFIRQYQQKACKPQNDKSLRDITILHNQLNFDPIQEGQRQIEKCQKTKQNQCSKEIDWIIYLEQFQKIGVAYVTSQNFMVVRFNDQVMVIAHPQLQRLQIFNFYDSRNDVNFEFLEIYQFQKKLPNHFKLFYSIASRLIQNLVIPQKQNVQRQSDFFDRKFKFPKNIYPFQNGHIIQFSSIEAQFIQQNKIFIKINQKQVLYEYQNQSIAVLKTDSEINPVQGYMTKRGDKSNKQKIISILRQVNKLYQSK